MLLAVDTCRQFFADIDAIFADDDAYCCVFFSLFRRLILLMLPLCCRGADFAIDIFRRHDCRR